jgi:hypothetical protein
MWRLSVGTERSEEVSSVMCRRARADQGGALHCVRHWYVKLRDDCRKAQLVSGCHRRFLPPVTASETLLLPTTYHLLQAPAQYEDTCDASLLGPDMNTPYRRAACPDPSASALVPAP